MAGYEAFNAMLAKRGAFSGQPLQPPTTAKTVRVANGSPTITDGPFAETKEWLSGYYLVDCDSAEEALGLAAQIPSSRFGSVEVRPIMEMH